MACFCREPQILDLDGKAFASDKHSSLLQKFVKYGQNCFITLAPQLFLYYDLGQQFPNLVKSPMSEHRMGITLVVS